MKHNLLNFTLIFITFFFLILLFLDPSISKSSIETSFNIWLHSLFPSIFPMIIINDILINYNFGNIISSLFYPIINKVFKLSYQATYIFIMSLFIGTPTNACLLKEYLDKKLIDTDEANKLIYVLYFSNPLFLYNMLNLMFDNFTSIKIILYHYISNSIILFFIRNKYISKNNVKTNCQRLPLGNVITLSSKKAINTLLTILGIISFYNLIISYIPNIFLIKGFLEITNGLNHLVLNINAYNKLYSIIIINFGGLSIYSQIKSILEDTHINFKNYFIGRFMQILISLMLDLV